ncbi:unnamed protein product (macronuclear) [Paramecium tetraurelia]|uniref:Uncharacterized protein n=1 Tax=Paramecium tetraurelia TaxID=5888 RepID=A0BTG4_PARTE|nr:uncharacterized protein GSPATT00032063001 [Paramecium tetraurelia]CAK61831.1 unnamed protein product [Paramecium tetraurelia]|eukprot:XP_001429229.1 hypothetical protein (macronuclear) [Paramecium tetraurelia strain d4-2]
MDRELISITITNYKSDENVEGPYEKQFRSDCTMAQVLQEFGLDSALIVGYKDIIESNKILKKVYEESPQFISQGYQPKQLQLKIIHQQNNLQGNTKCKFYIKNVVDQPFIEYILVDQNYTICSKIKAENSVIHNNKIADREEQFKNIQSDHQIELSIIPNSEGEIDKLSQMQVQIFSDQIQNHGSYKDGNVIREKLLYLEIEEKSIIIQSLIEKFNNKNNDNIFAPLKQQRDFGILKENCKIISETESLCKLIGLRNEKQGNHLQQRADEQKRIVNVFYNGKQILHEIFEKDDEVKAIDNKLPEELRGKVDFIIPDNVVVQEYQELGELSYNVNDEINLQVINRQVLYDKMETVLKQALQQVQKLKQDQNDIEIREDQNDIKIKQELSAYSLILEKDQTIDRLQQVIEQLRFKKSKQEQILEIQNITETVSKQIDT